MHPEKANPAALPTRQGPDKSKRAALIVGLSSTEPVKPEDIAASFLATKFGLSVSVARVVAALAGLGGRLS